jgi:hypothetical protein
VGLVVRAHADVLDSVTVSLFCKNYTVAVTGHGLDPPTQQCNSNGALALGSLGPGMAFIGAADKLLVNPKPDKTFTASVTRP